MITLIREISVKTASVLAVDQVHYREEAAFIQVGLSHTNVHWERMGGGRGVIILEVHAVLKHPKVSSGKNFLSHSI